MNHNTLIQQFGDAATNVFEQMLKGNWKDDHGHDVKNNVHMMALADAVRTAIAFRDSPEYLITVRAALEQAAKICEQTYVEPGDLQTAPCSEAAAKIRALITAGG